MKRFLSLLLLGAGCLAAAPLTFQVTVNTSSFVGQNARADFQFNPGGIPDLAVLVTDSLSGVGSISEVSRAGDVTGSGPWTFGNTQANNQLVLGLGNLGSSLQFLVSFSGDAIDNPSSFDSTSFFFTLLDSTGTAPLNGFSSPSLWVDVSGGLVSVFSQDSSISFEAATTAIPEPGTLLLLSLGLAAGLALRRSR